MPFFSSNFRIPRIILSGMRYIGAVALLVVVNACSLRDLVDVDTSQNEDATVDDAIVNTYNGALGLYYAAIGQAASAFRTYTWQSAHWTDEMNAVNEQNEPQIDARTNDSLYAFDAFSKLRTNTQYAISALQNYPLQRPPAYVGEMYGLLGLAEVALAEGFCSGIPLITATYGQNFQYSRGFTTEEVLQHAIAMFDSALAYGVDSPAIVTLARVGKARALMNLGEYAQAVTHVESVSLGAHYQLYYTSPYDLIDTRPTVRLGNFGRVVNAEGVNGLHWLADQASEQDPRVPVTLDTIGLDVQFAIPTRQQKYFPGPETMFLADGIEARLIIAEAALRANDITTWAQILNTLRATGISPAIPALPADSTIAADSALRVDVMFRERAFWLFLTGHRQGDLRRLIRHYGRTVLDTYPIGPYTFPAAGRSDYNHLVTMYPDEGTKNPLYTGCLSREP